jgi:hypothetical protein
MKRGREILVVVAILGGLFAYWIGSEICYARHISPKGVSTVADFFNRFGEPRRVRIVEREGQNFYEFTGQLPAVGSFALPSAAPAYIFDEQGKFTGWCRDPGDAQNYRRRWPLQSTNLVEINLVKQKFGLK